MTKKDLLTDPKEIVELIEAMPSNSTWEQNNKQAALNYVESFVHTGKMKPIMKGFAALKGAKAIPVVLNRYNNIRYLDVIEYDGENYVVSGNFRNDGKYTIIPLDIYADPFNHERNVRSESGANKIPEPNRIGSPTQKKLDDWVKYWKEVTKTENEYVDKINDENTRRLQAILAVFPDIKPGYNGYYEIQRGGWIYRFKINDNGYFEEQLEHKYISSSFENFLALSDNKYVEKKRF